MKQSDAKSAFAHPLRASLFGEFSLETRSGDPIHIKNRRAALVLAILCLQPDQSIDREALVKLLWHDRFPAQAKASLRQCLLDLRKNLDDLEIDVLRVARKEVTLLTDGLTSDLAGLQTELSESMFESVAQRLMDIGNRPLLEGRSLNPAFDGWLASRREYFDAQLKSALAGALVRAEKEDQACL